MRIAVIGTGNVGKALGGSLVRSGHAVTFAARDADKTRQVAQELGAASAGSASEAVRQADVVILAVPYGSLDDVAREIAPVSHGKLVVDVTNPIKPDYSGLANEGGPSAAEQLAQKLGDAHVAKAFNTLFSSLQAQPDTHGTRLDALYAADDERAGRQLAELISSLGFRPVDAGSLAAARQLEALGWLNIQLQTRHGGDWSSAFVLLGAPQKATREPAGARVSA